MSRAISTTISILLCLGSTWAQAACVRPAVSLTPGLATICSPNTALFTASFNGSPTPTLQWYMNGGPIDGAVSSSYTAKDPGCYTVVATNECGSTTSNSACLIVNKPPTAVVTPGNATICSPNTTQFTVRIGGSPTPTLQWCLNGNPISGAEGSSLTTGTPGCYTVVATNGCGSTTSNSACLALNSPPVITLQPVDTTVCLPNKAKLVVEATGTPPPTYQWRLNASNISGATDSSYETVTEGTYDCIVTNSCGSLTSSMAVVLAFPSVSVHCPDAMTAVAGADCRAAVPEMKAKPILLNECNVDMTISQSPAPGTMVGLGEHTITLTASNSSGIVSTCQTTFTVLDKTPPQIIAPPNVTAELCGLDKVFIGAPDVLDNCDPSPKVTNDAPALFPIGATMVKWTACDASGNSSTAIQNVTILPLPTLEYTGLFFGSFGSASLATRVRQNGASKPGMQVSFKGTTLWGSGGTAGPVTTNVLGIASLMPNWPVDIYEVTANETKGCASTPPVVVTIYASYAKGIYAGGALILGLDGRLATFGIRHASSDALLFLDPLNSQGAVRVSCQTFRNVTDVSSTTKKFTGTCSFRIGDGAATNRSFEAIVTSSPGAEQFSLKVFDYSMQAIYQASGDIKQGGVKLIP